MCFVDKMGKISNTQRGLKHRDSKTARRFATETGRIGKPQRSKKHKKLKSVDFPDDDNSKRSNRHRNDRSANRAPANDDDYQEIPKKAKIIGDNRNMPKKKRKKEVRDPVYVERGMTRPLKSVPKFVKHKNENEKTFMGRVERETQRTILKAKLSNKYKVDFDQLDHGNNVIKRRTKKTQKNTERLKERKKIKALKKAERREDKMGDFSHLQNRVEFGDTVMEPPSLTAKPRKAQTDSGKERPGKRSLLLKEIMDSNLSHNNSSRQLGQSTKRKNLSLAKQQVMDKEREKAILLYRQLKNKPI